MAIVSRFCDEAPWRDTPKAGGLAPFLAQLAASHSKFQRHAEAALRLQERRAAGESRRCEAAEAGPRVRRQNTPIHALGEGATEPELLTPRCPGRSAGGDRVQTLLGALALHRRGALDLGLALGAGGPGCGSGGPVSAGAGRAVCARAPAYTGERGTAGLRMASGAFSVPHPDKASQGADSYFVAPSGAGVGVADGVGEWEWRFGCDPRAFADELMAGSLAAVELRALEGEGGYDPGFSAYLAMRSGFGQARAFGSSTALVAALHSDIGVLGVANLGDSALLQLRRDGVGPDTRFRVVARTLEQQHFFNCPFQLSRVPKEEDIPRLLAEGKRRLARAVTRRPQVKQDLPEDADRYSLLVEEGDLLLVGTDGVFDNLHDHEICDLLAGLCPEAERASPERLAEAVVNAACERSRSQEASSPFSVSARSSGYDHAGGKKDDVTCVCAWLVH